MKNHLGKPLVIIHEVRLPGVRYRKTKNAYWRTIPMKLAKPMEGAAHPEPHCSPGSVLVVREYPVRKSTGQHEGGEKI